MRNTEVYRVGDSYELYEYLMENMEDLEDKWITVITSSQTAKDLMFYCMDDEYKIELVDINDWDYDDLYIVSIDDEAVSVEPAKRREKYLWSDGEIFVDCSAEHSDEYIKAMTERFGCDFEMNYVRVGEEDDIKIFEYENEYDNGRTYASISVSSNVKDYVKMIGDFFEEYFRC